MSRDDRRYEYSIGTGWRPLVDPLIELCEANGGKVAQIKEKFGGLRFYYDEPDRETQTSDQKRFWTDFNQSVREAEALSFRTCEETGHPGKPYSRLATGGHGWVRTLAPEVAHERGYLVEELMP